MFRTATLPRIEQIALEKLAKQLEGEFYFDETIRKLYATDASAYREMPLAVALPKTEKDISILIDFARQHKTSLIPRTAGTSLAGQVVGNGIVVDVSKYFTKILEINAEERWVRVQPGVVRDDLNHFLKPYGLMFGPETSTANRAMIGGMIGNNSCGSNSVVYGSTREHLLEVKGFLSDNSKVSLPAPGSPSPALPEGEGVIDSPPPKEGVGGRLSEILQKFNEILQNPDNQAEIRKQFPKSSIPRRNTGYALDLCLPPALPEGEGESLPPTPSEGGGVLFAPPPSEGAGGRLLGEELCKLIAGSEGTLMFITEAKLNLVPIPSPHRALVCGHYHSIDESLHANLVALKYQPSAVELMDHYVLERTKGNIEQSKNRFFVQGDPQAILVVEIIRDTEAEVDEVVNQLITDLKANNYGYHFPILKGEDMPKIWALRKAGLGLLSNIPGDAKPVAVIEDTAVDVNDLPDFIREFNEILTKNGMFSVHYAHAGSGELHLRPIIDLKTEEGYRQFRLIAEEIATLVKKYQGSLSGEHGDGRLRGEFIPQMVGEKVYQLFKEIKQIFDPENIFNPGKIVDTPPMDTFLRYQANQQTPDFETVMDFSQNLGILRAAEQCNGSGDCRKTEISGGTMCPSFMATRNEKDTTRARANILREVLTNSTAKNPFASPEIKEVMDLCLSCKGCKSECPSNVDVGKMKAEFLHQYYQTQGVPFRTWVIGNFTNANKLASILPGFYNWFITNSLTANLFKKIVGFAPQRSLPKLYKTTLRKWYKSLPPAPSEGGGAIISSPPSEELEGALGLRGSLYLFCDEFTNYNDTEVGITAIQLLQKLGYEVKMVKHAESGRTYLSKGLLKQARKIAERNVLIFNDLINEKIPLIGIEPSAILTFRDEYIDLLRGDLQEKARKIAQNTFTIEEFIAKEIDKGNIKREQFTTEKKLVKVHGHCHQKALSSMTPTKKMLSLPQNYEVHQIPSGCCGMAGSFGYETEHFEVSQKIGELVLFPTVRKQPEDVIICASGTSCRHQIKDGTGRIAKHAVEILWEALLKN
ncbi:MAG: FAD-binding protein [Microscillaceae bacterium]|jgi:FAD/FMN-containing dehydrogenase/Fe-S oxidoreductase|nr:FAD-binding protein [Microscillaceae bacterium]